jgi:MFS family permease
MRVWTYANIVGTAGTWMQLVAQNLLVLQLTGSTAATGLSIAAQAAPALLLGVRGGVLVDRLPLAVTATVGQVLLALVAFATAALAVLGLLSVPVLIVLGALGGLVATVEGPACALFGNDLVAQDDVPSAIAVGSVVGNLGRLAGTAAAGTAIAWFGIPGAYVANGLSFLAVALVIPFLKPVQAPAAFHEHLIDVDQVRPLRFIVTQPVLLGLAAVTLVATLLGRNYSISMAALVTGPMALDAAT